VRCGIDGVRYRIDCGGQPGGGIASSSSSFSIKVKKGCGLEIV
jgi:hypothetical protein